MDHGGIAGVEPAVADGARRRLRIVVIALHHDIAAHDDLAQSRAVSRHLEVRFVDDADLARGDQLDPLAGFEHRPRCQRERAILGSRLADRDERRGLGEAVGLGDLPAELALHPLDGGGGRRSARRDDVDAARHLTADLGRCGGEPDQHRGRGAEPGRPLVAEEAEDPGRLDLRQADVGGADGGHRPDEGPAVGVEHRERPEVAVAHPQRQVEQGSDGVQVGVPVGDHDALGTRCGTACVVDRQQLAFADLGRPGEAFPRALQLRLVIEPALPRRTVQVHEVLDRGQLGADGVDRLLVLGLDAEHRGTGVVDDVIEVGGRQPVVDRYQNRAELRHGVEGLQLGVSVRGDVGDPVAASHAKGLEAGRPAITAAQELLVGEAQLAIHHRLAIPVQPARAASELERAQWRLHATSLANFRNLQ